MGWRIVYIEESNSVTLYLDNLKIHNNNGEILIPLKDIDVLLIDNYKATISAQLLIKCSLNKINVIICDVNHIPYAQSLPIEGHCLSSKLLKEQINWNSETKGKLWRNIVIQKISNQLEVLKKNVVNEKAMCLIENLLKDVEFYDASNREGLVAKIYFRALFGEKFVRFADDSINAGLNYGYIVLRTMISKSIVAKGLNPMLGIFHRKENNSFNLADDLIEVFRPIIDNFVYKRITKETVFCREIRLEILSHLTKKIKINDKKQTISNAIDIFVDSIVNYFEKGTEVSFPSIEVYDL